MSTEPYVVKIKIHDCFSFHTSSGPVIDTANLHGVVSRLRALPDSSGFNIYLKKKTLEITVKCNILMYYIQYIRYNVFGSYYLSYYKYDRCNPTLFDPLEGWGGLQVLYRLCIIQTISLTCNIRCSLIQSMLL